MSIDSRHLDEQSKSELTKRAQTLLVDALTDELKLKTASELVAFLDSLNTAEKTVTSHREKLDVQTSLDDRPCNIYDYFKKLADTCGMTKTQFMKWHNIPYSDCYFSSLSTGKNFPSEEALNAFLPSFAKYGFDTDTIKAQYFKEAADRRRSKIKDIL